VIGGGPGFDAVDAVASSGRSGIFIATGDLKGDQLR